YFLIPKFRIGIIWQKLGNTKKSDNILISHLRLYKKKQFLYDASYTQEYDTPIIWWNSIESKP
ncbi:13572_t:CDS:2, partial [Racocetra persica]